MLKDIDCFVTQKASPHSISHTDDDERRPLDRQAGSCWSVFLHNPVAAANTMFHGATTGNIPAHTTLDPTFLDGFPLDYLYRAHTGATYTGGSHPIQGAEPTVHKDGNDYTMFVINDPRVRHLFDNGFIRDGTPVELSTKSTALISSGKGTFDTANHTLPMKANDYVLPLGQTFYVFNPIRGGDPPTDPTGGPTDPTGGREVLLTTHDGNNAASYRTDNRVGFGIRRVRLGAPIHLSDLAYRNPASGARVDRTAFTVSTDPVTGVITYDFGSTLTPNAFTPKFIFREPNPVAYVTDKKSEWIMSPYADFPLQLDVGDRIRIGTTGTQGFTDYVTVLERQKVTQLGNGITTDDRQVTYNGIVLPAPQSLTSQTTKSFDPLNSSRATLNDFLGNRAMLATDYDGALLFDEPKSVKIRLTTGSNSLAVNGLAMPIVSNPKLINLPQTLSDHVAMDAGGVIQDGFYANSPCDVYCYRLSHVVDASAVPNENIYLAHQGDQTKTALNFEARELATWRPPLLGYTGAVSVQEANGLTWHPTAAIAQRFYPVYKQHNSRPVSLEETVTGRHTEVIKAPMIVPFNHTVKCVHGIKLMAYSINMTGDGHEYHHNHEMDPTQWFALNLAGVNGEVMSNNRYADGAFAVLHAGDTRDSVSSTIEFYESQPEGIVSVEFERPITTMRELRVSLVDALGKVPKLSRIHLWFKLRVTQG